jgi:N-acetylglucosaminyldiphosphoundecaprenol N-acetyl-beta-D-mannosaminyltransferase
MNMSQAIETVGNAIEKQLKLFVVVPNVFVVTECGRNEYYKKVINSAGIAFADGVPLVWASFLLGQYTGGRVSGADFFFRFNQIAEREGYSCYFLGGGPGGSEKVVQSLRRRCPSLRIVGNFSPPMGEISWHLSLEIVERINTVRPNILWVGLGAPRQEMWIHKNFDKLKVNVAIGVGAAFDYEAGKKRRAPVWMQKMGMEWSYRILFENPTLLWKKRYHAYIWEFILPVAAQIIRARIAMFFEARKHV